MKHDNKNLICPECERLFNYYPGFHQGLKDWFYEVRARDLTTHISCAGRGKAAQEAAKSSKRSRASWEESSHNWNAAIDVFRNKIGHVYDRDWFEKVIAPYLEDLVKWYGAKDAEFQELPHCEVKDWKSLSKNGILKLVE